MDINYENLLENVELFKGISLDEIEKLLVCLEPKYFKYFKGENIFIEGEAYRGIGVIITGEIMITKENASGNRMIYNKFTKNHIFGEMIAFSNIKKWPANVTAIEDASIMYIIP